MVELLGRRLDACLPGIDWMATISDARFLLLCLFCPG
jgi:hypothetical protein